MTVVIDTSVLVALAHVRDSKHTESKALMQRILSGHYGLPVTSDYVLDEGLTLLQRRSGNPKAAADFASFFLGDEKDPAPIDMRFMDKEGIQQALELHLDRYARRLSFTDCVLATMAQRLGAPIASFDSGFDGVVPRIDS